MSDKGYPASPETKSSQKIISGDEQYISRLRKKEFFDQELLFCETVDQVLDLERKREYSQKRHDNGLLMMDARKASSFSIASDDATYPGIPLEVELTDDELEEHLHKQNQNSYRVITENDQYTQFEYEQLQETLEDIADQVKDVLTDTSKVFHDLKKEVVSDVSNSDFLYDLAQKSKWKTMMDFQGFVLPGCGTRYETCGTIRFSKCPDHNYGKRIFHHCNRMSCPTCVKKTGKKTAKKIERRIWLYRLMIQKLSNNKRNSKPSHIVESIPADDVFWTWSKGKQQRVLKEMRKIAGIWGGVSLTHYWRFQPGKKDPYVSIHNHLIGFGWLSQTAKADIFKKFGVNVVYHKTKKGTLHSRGNVFSVAYYLLSHVAIKSNKHSLQWFGALSYRKVSNSYLKQFRDIEYLNEDADIERSKSCEYCGLTMVPAKIDQKLANWKKLLPDPSDMENGCGFAPGLLVELKLYEERMQFYDADTYRIIYAKTKKEREAEMKPLSFVYTRKVDSLKIDKFF